MPRSVSEKNVKGFYHLYVDKKINFLLNYGMKLKMIIHNISMVKFCFVMFACDENHQDTKIVS
jgi:hypothetical protein